MRKLFLLLLLSLSMLLPAAKKYKIHALGDLGLPENHEQMILRFDKVIPNFDDHVESLPSKYLAPITPAKNQGGCGSCWAFATVGVLEARILAQDSISLDLSEQQLVSCDTVNAGCSGGNFSASYYNNNGPMRESCTGYQASNTACSTLGHCSELSIRTSGSYWVAMDQTHIKTSIHTNGPGYFRFDVYPDFDKFWGTGTKGQVYKHTGSGKMRGGHAVLIYGWDDSKQAYKCKNSWGATSGPQGDGTFWISYDLTGIGAGMGNVTTVTSTFKLTAAFKADDSGNQLSTTLTSNGTTWTTPPNVSTNVSLKKSPALAPFGKKLYAAFQGNGTQKRLFISSSTDGVNWGTALSWSNNTLQNSPGMAAFNNRLYIAFKANDPTNQLYVTSSANPDGKSWKTMKVPANALQNSPALATFGSKLYCAYKANDFSNKLYMTWSSDGTGWVGPQYLAGPGYPTISLQNSPAMTAFKNKLYIAFKSNDSSNTFYVCSTLTPDVRTSWTVKGYPSIRLQNSPALAVYNDKMYVVFKANDSSDILYVSSTSDGLTWSAAQGYSGIKLANSPALAVLETN